ncbi:MAG: hypothetical protein LC646_11740 [Xanthomonadaceae bacterium]|nr:hypothetical protein [Xanthomonadaceae bacterium]
MDPDIVNLHPLRVMPKTIEATCYNQVRLSLLRLGHPLRVPLPEHRGLEIILENDHWLCVDSAFDDQPIMAWLDFDTRRHNQALHEPVPCELRLYHMHAGLVMGSALAAMEQSLSIRLADRAT